MTKPENPTSGRVKILSVEIDNLTRRELLEKIEGYLAGSTPRQIATVNAEFVVAAEGCPAFRQVLRESAVNTADGIGILWAAAFLSLPLTRARPLRLPHLLWQILSSGVRLMFDRRFQTAVIKEKISGSDLIWHIAKLAEQNGKSVYVLGGYGDTPKVVAERLRQKFPKLKIAGYYAGTAKEEGIVERVANSRADILFLAFGPITQEKWIAQNLEKLGCRVAIGLGGTFDYIAQKKPKVPDFLRGRGLEWAYRLLTQPYRWKRIINAVPVFVWYVARYKLQLLKPYRENVVACVLNSRNEILICRRKGSNVFFDWEGQDCWQLPQGGLETGESLETGFARELFEETGIKHPKILGILKNIHRYDWPLSFARQSYGGTYRGQEQSIVFARIDESKETIVLDNREFDDFAWVGKDQLLSSVHPIRRDLAKVVYENLGKYENKTARLFSSVM